MALQTRTKKRSKKPLIIATTVVLVLLGGYTAYAATSSSWPFTTTSKTDTDSQNIPPNNEQTTPSSDDASDSTPSGTDKTPPQSTPPENGSSTSSSELTGVVNYKEISDGNLVIRNTINQRVSGGSCELTLTDSSGHTVRRSAGIVANPSSSTCEGFSVSMSELHSGSWNISISLTSGDQHGTIRSSVSL